MVAMHSSKAVIVGSLVSVGLAATALAIGLHLAISMDNFETPSKGTVQVEASATILRVSPGCFARIGDRPHPHPADRMGMAMSVGSSV